MAITTAEQLLRAGDIGRCELVRGELRTMIPPGFEHGRIAANLAGLLWHHARSNNLGTITAAETGFLLARSPDTVRAPDVAFVRATRPPGPERGYYPGAPDLAVEVLSPDDRPGYVREKVAEWLEAGALAVWVVDPRTRTVTIHETVRSSRAFRETDVIPGGDLLPGLELAVRELFE
ncbi:MAG: Uma2 family endonuclease [Planctomycetota bacterium]|jgi:Uma2 family endonuclease